MKQKTKLIIATSVIFLLVVTLFLFERENIKSDKFVYGVCSHGSHYQSNQLGVEKLGELGVSMIRDDLVWREVEPLRGFYDFSSYDSRMDKLSKENISVLWILAYGNPNYITTPDDIRLYQQTQNSWAQYIPSDNPQEFEVFKKAYGNFCYESVKHFKTKGQKYYEIWNEPYIQTFWFPNPNAQRFTELLKECYTRGKEADPNAVFLANPDANFLNTMYIYGAKDYFDILSYHPYCYPNDPSDYTKCGGMSSLIEAHNTMVAYGDGNKPVWITEMGYPTSNCDKNGQNCKSVSLEGQKEYLKKTLEAINRDMPYVKGFFWYDFKDDGTTTWNEHNFGLLYYNYSNKPSFDFYKQVIAESKNNG